jgi:ubiquinone/menaquinone biosynthesis C-methylase UbiE
MTGLNAFLDDKLYPGVDGHWDDQLFRECILRFVGPDSQVLDIGAGAGIVSEMNFKDVAKRVAGVDPDERVVDNPYLHDAHIGTGEKLPFDDETFDVAFADNVMEHLENPQKVFREINRVLKPGGVFLGKTPNAWHYMPLIARTTPHWFHRIVNKARGRAVVDTFPTRYRANTPSAVRKLAAATGFKPISIERFEGRPEYLRITPPTYLVGWGYEKLVNSTRLLSPFRILLIVALRKEGGSPAGRSQGTAG